MKLVRGPGPMHRGEHDLSEARGLCIAKPGTLAEFKPNNEATY